MHVFTLSFLFFVWQNLAGMFVWCQEPVERSDYYKGYGCSDEKMESVLKAIVSPSDEIAPAFSPLHCFTLCSSRSGDDAADECAYAIYRNATQSCKLVGVNTDTFLDEFPHDVNESECHIAKQLTLNTTNTAMSCQNDGTPLNFTCECSTQFTGRFCEIANPIYCQSGDTEMVNDLYKVTELKIPVKMVIGGEIILSVKTFDYKSLSTGYFVQAHPFLDLTDSTGVSSNETISFTTPFRWSFFLYDLDYGTIETAQIPMDGNNGATHSFHTGGVVMFAPRNLDSDMVVFEPDRGSMADVVDALSKGHRKMERELGGVDYDADHNYTSFQNVLSRIKTYESGHTSVTWDEPLQYETFKDTPSRTWYRYYTVLNSTRPPVAYDTNSILPMWAVDRCWTRVNPTLDYDVFTSALKEFMERGLEFRVVIDNKLSSDVVEMEATGSDVTVQLAGRLTDHGIYLRSVVSRTKTFAHCSTEFQGANVVRYEVNLETDSDIAWYVSSKQWRLIYSVNNTGGGLHGDLSQLIYLAKDVGKNTRVCVHYAKENCSLACHGSASITYSTLSGAQELIFQTDPFFGLEYEKAVDDNEDACVFRGVKDSTDCRQYVHLISTNGWIREATVLMGSSQSYVQHVDFERIDWFVDD